MSKLTYAEINEHLRETSKMSKDVFDSYAYVTGLYESMLGGLVADLPKHKQLEVLRTLQSARDSMKKMN